MDLRATVWKKMEDLKYTNSLISRIYDNNLPLRCVLESDH